jgi:PAS domain S-box-containing protein
MYGVASYIPMALPTALLLLLLAIAVLCVRPGSGMMAVFTRASAGGAIARRLLPAMVGSMFVLGWLRLEGEHRGLYGAELGVALYTLANIAIFSMLVWWSAMSIDRSEARRRHVEEERERFFAVTPDLLCVAGFDGYFKSVNQAWENLLGYPRDELLARPLLELVHPDDRAETAARMAVLTDGIPVVGFENRYRRRDGEYCWFSWNATPVTGEQQIYATARDITARKQAEELQAKMAAIVEFSDDAIMSKTLEGTITTWNPGAERLFGHSAEEAIGKPMAMLIPPELDGEEARILEGVRRGEVQHFESVRMHKDGRRIHVAASISPLRGRAGAIVGASKVARDISERKRAEESILALNTELGANAAQLQQANRELEAFSYTISHDLRAPLRHIDGYARMLQEDATLLEPELRRYLDAISASARTMGMLIDDLLAFSRLGRKPIDRVRVDMIQLARHAMREAGAEASESSIVVGELPDAHGDPVLLKQVWVNLLSNAVKYSTPRGAAARIEVSGERDGGVIRYRVRDNGVGFDMRYADKLFGVFQRLHSQDEFEGTGVGLAIVQRIVARHGGRVWAESQPGQGATFTIELPPAETRETKDIA